MSEGTDIVDAKVPRMRHIADELSDKAGAAESFKDVLLSTGSRLAMGFETWAPAQVCIELEDELAATARVLRTRARMAELADQGKSFDHLLFAFNQQVDGLRSGLDDGVGASGGAADRKAQIERIAFPDGVPTQSSYDPRSPAEWEAEVLAGPILEAAGPYEAFEYWSSLNEEQKVAAFEHAADQVETHYKRVGGDVPVGVRYSPQGARAIEELLGNSTPRSSGDTGFNLVTDSPRWMQEAARWWIQRNHEGEPWDAPQTDGLYVQDVPLWVIAMWLGPEADAGSAAAAVGVLPAAPDAVPYGEDAPLPYDRYSGNGERVLPAHGDGVLMLAEFFAFSADGGTIVTSVPLGAPDPSDVITLGISALATAYVLADTDYDPNVKVDPDNTWTDLSGAPVWPPSLGSSGN